MIFFISAIWLLAITAPSVLQLLDEQNSCMTYSLNEEEPEEEVNIDKGEETIISVPESLRGFLLSLYSERAGTDASLSFNLLFQEIPLPPPEELS